MAKPETLAQDEIVSIFFGINPKTYEVESVTSTRGGTLSRKSGDAADLAANVPVEAARHEVVHRFGLVEIVEASVRETSDAQRRKIIEDLETKAEIMKQENSE